MMENERKLRLIQVAKEFKVGLNTIVDYLQKKGVATDGSPNAHVTAEMYAMAGVGVFLMPIVVLAAGVVVWLKRRHL